MSQTAPDEHRRSRTAGRQLPSSSSRSRSRSMDPHNLTSLIRQRRRSEVSQHPVVSILLEDAAPSSEDDEGSATTAPTTLAGSDASLKRPANLLPSPFYPPSRAAGLAIAATHVPAPLPSHLPALPVYQALTQGDAKDVGTPDEGIWRDESLVRLTGRWPLNCEAPLRPLFDAGFLTPTPLFYVRNHGVVPQVSLQEALDWTLEVSGLVANPLTLTLANLLDPTLFTTETFPITLVCAGNRRKEQNVVSQSLGFSWGAAGLSTALFTGVLLADILDRVCPRDEDAIDAVDAVEAVPASDGVAAIVRVDAVAGRPARKARHVIFEGAEDLPEGKYGTSQKLGWARIREKGMMIAWAMNGEALEPDHGFPLRLVVPGQIGGRSVKWLKKIIVSDQESQHHLHFHDNKVLPTTLSAAQARAENKWWYDPRYLINELNTNSAIAHPAHNEVITVMPSLPAPQTYTLKGYAYAGGGRRVARVEVTLDAGTTWILADIAYPEDAYKEVTWKGDVWGKMDAETDQSFCWAFWELEVKVASLKGGSIAVRAIDESLSGQGEGMYWNPTGMMNNWWFRTAIHESTDAQGMTTLRFEHPTLPGTQSGGWMERLKEQGDDVLHPSFVAAPVTVAVVKKVAKKAKKVEVVMTDSAVTRKYTMEDVVRLGSTVEAPWFVVHGEVYDGKAFLDKHPGGSESITIVKGADATEDFMAIHSSDAKAKLAQFHIGTLVPSVTLPPTVESTVKIDPTFLSKTSWKAAELVSIDRVNHDSRVYKFALERVDQDLGLPCGMHVYARLKRKAPTRLTTNVEGVDEDEDGDEEEGGEMVMRAYTPVSSSNAKGFLELLIKIYHRTAQFPDGGKMSMGFEELKIGETVEFKGPLGSFEWLGSGMARWKGVERKASQIGMICGGSGITPIIQVLRGVIHDVADSSTRLWLLNANKTEEDILLRSSLDNLSGVVGPTRFQQHHCLSHAPEDWEHSRGRINVEMMKMHLPSPSDDGLILFCGPEAMVEGVVKPGLRELGWKVDECLVVF